MTAPRPLPDPVRPTRRRDLLTGVVVLAACAGPLFFLGWYLEQGWRPW